MYPRSSSAARNVLLFTMVADNQPHMTIIWNIFFHMYLDEDSHSVLVAQCRKLMELSESLQRWNVSPYGSLLRMCTEYTLAELRRHWALYVDMHNLPADRLKALHDAFSKQFKRTTGQYKSTLSTARSSGPLIMQAARVTSSQFTKYWSTGTTFGNPKQITAAKLLNPTFVYSLAGEGCSVHYGTDPIAPFHLAALFGNAKISVSVANVVEAAKTEFNHWCSAFHLSLSSGSVPIIRFFLGEATAVSRALRGFSETKTLNLGVPIAQWKTQLIQLAKDEYISGGAPASFNVIETSNLDDHIGLLNVLVAVVPLLSTSAQSNVLYTESLLVRGQDATKEFAERLYADITTIGLLVGLCPIDYISSFTSRSNTHELLLLQQRKGHTTQFHQVTTWKSPASGDVVSQNADDHPALIVDPHQLGTFLYDMYHQLFEHEDAIRFAELHQGNMGQAISASNIIHYIRESFALFLKLIRDKLCLSDERWLETMDRFFDLDDADKSMPMDANNYHDLCAQLHRHGVYTVRMYPGILPRIGRFSAWESIPVLTRIILVVPRSKISTIQSSMEKVGTPLLQCDIKGSWSHNIFSAVHVAFGKVIPTGTKSHPRVIFEEDLEGWRGSSSLVVSFTLPSRLLTDIEPPENFRVGFGVRSTTGTVVLVPILGLSLIIFSANLMDQSHVHVLPEQPLPTRKRPNAPLVPSIPPPTHIGRPHETVVDFDEECELVTTLTRRVSVENEKVKVLFASGAIPHVSQVSPCVMRVAIGASTQDIRYPFPIIGSQNRLRLARTSLYIEVNTHLSLIALVLTFRRSSSQSLAHLNLKG